MRQPTARRRRHRGIDADIGPTGPVAAQGAARQGARPPGRRGATPALFRCGL